MSLYKQYRPDSFDKVYGNVETKNAVSNLLKKGDKCPRVFLFYGLSGGGKTTFGRIIASMLKCSGPDYTEINSSDFRGVDMIRDLRDRTKFAPLKSKYRVFLIDECHQLTKIAQDAFLKLLEDTPSHVFFILCTTDRQMLKKAILNRCQEFEVKPLVCDEMGTLLKNICKSEKEKVGKKVLQEIIRQANGSARAGIQTLEKVLSIEEDQRLELAKQGAIIEAQGIELSRALMSRTISWKDVAAILNGLKGQDAESIRRQVLGYAQAILLNGKPSDRAGLILEEFDETTYNSGFPALTYMCFSVFKNA